MDIVTIQLKNDDSRYGDYNPDGSIKRWPHVDILGISYEQVNATVHRIDGNRFIVIPPDATHRLEVRSPEGVVLFPAPVEPPAVGMTLNNAPAVQEPVGPTAEGYFGRPAPDPSPDYLSPHDDSDDEEPPEAQ